MLKHSEVRAKGSSALGWVRDANRVITEARVLGDVLLLNAFVSASLHLSAVYPSFPVWHICVPNVVSCVLPVSLISPLDKIITQIITQAKWVPRSHTRCCHGDGKFQPGHWQERKPTSSIGHLVPTEVEVRGVGMDHRRGAVKRANFLIVTDIWKRKQRIQIWCF